VEIGLTLVWAIIVTVGLVILFGFLIRTRMKYENKFEKIKFTVEKERAEQIEKFKTTIIEERTDARELSRNTIKGRIGEQMSSLFPEFYAKYAPSDARFLGTPVDYVIFKNMSKFDKKTKDEENPIELVLLEIKTGKKVGLTDLEKSIKKAVEDGRVSFDMIRLNVEEIQIESEQKEMQTNHKPKEQTEKPNIQKIEAQKKHPEAYEKWTDSDDEFLINYWNNESNKQSNDEKIQELAKKFSRSKRAVESRLEKKGLE